MQMNVLVSAVLFLFIGPFDRASSWEAKTTGEPYKALFVWCIALFAISLLRHNMGTHKIESGNSVSSFLLTYDDEFFVLRFRI